MTLTPHLTRNEVSDNMKTPLFKAAVAYYDLSLVLCITILVGTRSATIVNWCLPQSLYHSRRACPAVF